MFRAASKTTNCLALGFPWALAHVRGGFICFQSLQEKIVQDCVLLSPDGVADALPGVVVTVGTYCMHKRKALEHPMQVRHASYHALCRGEALHDAGQNPIIASSIGKSQHTQVSKVCQHI